MVLPTEPSMPNTSEWQIVTTKMEEWCGWNVPSRRDEGVCGLSDVLEEMSPKLLKYFLSQKALQGITRRAAARGKKLPQLLEDAIAYMVKWWEAHPEMERQSPSTETN
jgi:hypothetical protein